VLNSTAVRALQLTGLTSTKQVEALFTALSQGVGGMPSLGKVERKQQVVSGRGWGGGGWGGCLSWAGWALPVSELGA
jgi:hypothetical protein